MKSMIKFIEAYGKDMKANHNAPGIVLPIKAVRDDVTKRKRQSVDNVQRINKYNRKLTSAMKFNQRLIPLLLQQYTKKLKIEVE